MGKFLIAIVLFAQFAEARDLDKLYSKSRIELAGHKLNVYIADDEGKRADGLMSIEKMPADAGMLFVFEDTRPLAFWMKNTLIPLSIGFFDEKGILIDVQEMEVPGSILELSPPAYQSRGPAAFALEMNKGWFDKNKVKVGTRLNLVDSPTSALLKTRLPAVSKTDQRRDSPK